MAGAWLPGQYENILRVTNLSKRLNIPLVWLVNCSGVKLTEQEKFYANRRGGGTTFFRHAGSCIRQLCLYALDLRMDNIALLQWWSYWEVGKSKLI